MLPTTFFSVILAGWSIFHLLHNFVMSNDYLGPIVDRFLDKNNIFITPLQIRYFSRKFNRCLAHFGRWRHLKGWFDAGILFGAIAMVGSTILLFHTLVRSVIDLNLFFVQPSAPSTAVLTVIVPGVNLPINDIWYLLASILLSGILHEMGHAVAATREGIGVNGCGIFIFILYPGAYVDLNSNDLNRATARKQLRIYCAGVWHNFVICLAACMLIFSLPFMLSPFYARGQNGVVVTHQTSNSPLRGPSGLTVGDTMGYIGGCQVTDTKSWFKCVNESRVMPQMGSCISSKNLQKLELKSPKSFQPPSIVSDVKSDCCGESPPPTHLCYHYMAAKKKVHACLPGRTMMSFSDCSNNLDCENDLITSTSAGICAFPLIDDPNTRFMRLEISRNSVPSTQHVLYLGEPADLIRFLSVSEYHPRWWGIPLRMPAILLKFLQYMFSMSGALAVLNIVPCYALDGQWAFKSFLDFYFGQNSEFEIMKTRLTNIVLCSGTLLIVLNIVFGFINVLVK